MKRPPNIYLIVVISLIYLLLAAAFSQVMHFSRAFDEGYHLEYITFIKQNGHIPKTYTDRAQITRADFPPLYHLLVTAVSGSVIITEQPNFKYFWDSFRYRAIDHQTDNVWTLNTEDFTRPYVGPFLVWQIGRWLSILLSASTLVVVFFTLRETPLKQYPLAPLAGVALLAFIPRYIILGSTLNDDNLLGLMAALYFWMLLKVVNQPHKWWPFIALGLLLGVSMTVKYTLVLVPLELIAVCGLIAYKNGPNWLWAGQRLLTIAGLALLSSSWWFAWNIWFLNTVEQNGWFVGLLNPLFAGGADATMNRLSGLLSGGQIGSTDLPENIIVGTFSRWIQDTFISFWGVGINGVIPLYPYIYIPITLMLGLALFGLWRLWQADKSAPKWITLFLFHTLLFVILPFIRFCLTRRLSVAAQGRHILVPAAAALMALLVWGLATAIPKRWQRPIFATIIVALIGWTGVHLYRLSTSAPPLLPLRANPQAAEWLSQPVNVHFGEAIKLVSYNINPQPEQGELHLDLAWQALGQVNENYLLQVELINSEGQVVSHWMGYNGQGRVPTLAWDAGDSVFDRLVLPLPDLPAGNYRLQVQVLSNSGPLVVSKAEDRGGAGEEDNSETSHSKLLALTEISLNKKSTLKLSPNTSIVGDGLVTPVDINLALWRTDGPVDIIQNPEYRYPATISIITSLNGLDLALIDPSGQLWPPTRSTANIHTFVIDPRWQSGAYNLQLTLKEDDVALGQTISNSILRVDNWWERHFVRPDIAVPLEANFANQVKFLGYKLPQTQVKAGEAFPITLYWQAPANISPQADFIQFNNLLDNDGELSGGYDRQPLEYYSTLLWAPDEIVIDGYAVPVVAAARPGQYYLNVGYYLIVGESAVNLPLVVEGQMTEVSSVTIGPIEVIAP